MLRYRIAGLYADCDIALPGRLAQLSDRGADVTIRRGSVPRWSGQNWAVDARRFRLEIPGVAHFLVSDGEHILYEPALDVWDGVPFLAENCVPAVLHQREVFALRAATVAVEGRALLLCGPTGAGASTLAAMLCRSGSDFVTDTLAAITMAAITMDKRQPPLVWPDGGGWSLFPDTMRYLGIEVRPEHRLRKGVEKYAVPAAVTSPVAPIPIAAICVLREWRPSRAVGLERLSPAFAAQALFENSVCPAVMTAMGQRARHFADSLAILAHIPVFCLTRPADFGALDGMAAELLDLLRSEQRHRA